MIGGGATPPMNNGANSNTNKNQKSPNKKTSSIQITTPSLLSDNGGASMMNRI